MLRRESHYVSFSTLLSVQTEARPRKHEQAKPEQQHAQQQQKQEQNKQTQQHAQQRSNERPQRTPEQQRVQQSAWQEHRSQRWDSDHRNWQQRGGYNGYRIPDNRYRGYFGRDHGFRNYGLPFLVVGGYPRFQYEGYWISLVDPWPEYWGNDWYDNDDVYVTYVDNGYYLQPQVSQRRNCDQHLDVAVWAGTASGEAVSLMNN